jgi:ABC-type transport system involved in Fe-S cluster assembly fused permease/ATPase subunit
MNQKDGTASAKVLDSLLNFETIKYFNAEEHEVGIYRHALGTSQKCFFPHL